MAHLAPDAAIFSPSVARLAASTAKDWSYVDAWLASKYKGRSPPPFERNPDTLKALLALAALNETADENRDLVARVASDALQELQAADNERKLHDSDESKVDLIEFKGDFFGALEDSLTKDGKASLDAMASAAVQSGMAFAEPAQIGQAMLYLQIRNFDLEQAVARVGVLQRYIDMEAARMSDLLEEVSSNEYRPSPDLARQNLDMQRKVKAMTKKLPEMKDKVSSLARAIGVPNPTIEQVRLEEERYLEMLEVKRSLDQQINEFDGLPPSTEDARSHLESMRRELRSITDRRDAIFENLVERETPRKRR
ncbi:hypothetical protein N0V93_008596 [Gnomoniopsis smithogilvyi]|uniref:Uncharacterized protein n=1 Tax=Gnomoniopsis smithogilvyi TaxID=1191159 RepID=A0A9W9CUY1_9PEZI|nr:hypothetical protein N0V93_008596 [Gnomoniopsis smithogilvyi]